MHQYDKSSKWLIQHHGDSILRLAGVLDIDSWQPLPAELVQSRRLPDGLIEVRRHGQAEPDLYVLEIATYPEARVADQVVDDTALVYLDRRVLPEVVVLFLHPKGNIEAAGAVNLRSRQGWTDWRLSWRIAKLWQVPAEEFMPLSVSATIRVPSVKHSIVSVPSITLHLPTIAFSGFDEHKTNKERMNAMARQLSGFLKPLCWILMIFRFV